MSHRYEHLTEMLADVEVDIFRPWVQNATKKRKDTVGRGAEEEVVGWCTGGLAVLDYEDRRKSVLLVICKTASRSIQTRVGIPILEVVALL